MIKQIFAAAWLGLIGGWLTFGWALQNAPLYPTPGSPTPPAFTNTF
jgi:hypothetical protein